MRNLKKHLEKIYRKVALKLVQRPAAPPAEPIVGSTAADGSPEVANAAGSEGTAGREGERTPANLTLVYCTSSAVLLSACRDQEAGLWVWQHTWIGGLGAHAVTHSRFGCCRQSGCSRKWLDHGGGEGACRLCGAATVHERPHLRGHAPRGGNGPRLVCPGRQLPLH